MYNSRSQLATRNCCVVQFTVLIGFMLPITRLFLLRNLTLESYLLKMTKSQLPINQITPQSIISKVTNNENERLWKTVKLARTSFQKLQLQWISFNLLRLRFFVYPRLLFHVLFIHPFNVWRCYFYIFLNSWLATTWQGGHVGSNMAAVTSRANQQFGDSSHCLNFAKFRNTAPLS